MLQKRREKILAAKRVVPTEAPPSQANARVISEDQFLNRKFLNFPQGIPIKHIDLKKQA